MAIEVKSGIFALALIVAAVTVGCGGDTAEPSTVTVAEPAETRPNKPGVTRQEFIEKADEICGDSLDELTPLGDRLARLTENEDIGLARFFERFAEVLHDVGIVYEDMAIALDELKRPRGDGAVVGRFIRLLDQIPLQLDVSAASIRSLNIGGLNQARRRMYRSLLRAQGIADGYGFKICGRKRPGSLDRGLRGELNLS